MNNQEIDEAIDNNPGGTDLEIALAIGCSEEDVKRRRAAAKQKEDQRKAEEAKKLGKSQPAKPLAPVAAAPAKDESKPKKQRFFLRDPETNGSIELIRVNAGSTMVIFEKVRNPEPVDPSRLFG